MSANTAMAALIMSGARANNERFQALKDAVSFALYTPGPPEAIELQAQQSIALSMSYSLEGDDLVWAQGIYAETVKKLTELLGEDAHCSQVDSEMFNSFSDIFKDETNSRPRFHVTRQDAEAWLKLRCNPTAS